MQIEAWDAVAKDVDFNLEIDTSEFIHLVPNNTSILDYGCGYGRISELLNSLGYNNILGVDTSSQMISRGRLEYPYLSLQLNKGIPLKHSDERFGAIVVCGVLTCTPDHHAKKNFLAEIIRLLAPNGILHMVEFCNETNKTFESEIGVSMHHQRPNQLRNLLSVFTELKFEVIQTQTMSGMNVEAVDYFGQKA